MVNIGYSKKTKWIGGSIAILGILMLGFFLVLSQKGYYRSGLSLVKGGTLLIAIPEKETKIFIDNEKSYTSSEDNDVWRKTLKPGSYEILVFKEGLWPWTKKIEMSPGEETKIAPFLLDANPQAKILSPDDLLYREGEVAIASAISGKSPRQKISRDNEILLWSNGNEIRAAWNGLCEEAKECPRQEQIVFAGDRPILNFDFYKNRNDVVIFSTGENIFAIELDKRGTQNFQPVFSGKELRFQAIGNRLYVKDGADLMLIEL